MRWCPALKILCYYGNQKERKAKRYGWHKSKTFNVCITSYKLVIQDYSIFKRKKWYLIVLDEAQNIKNFKSKRWQMMLNFRAKRKLLLTGTPLQNDIMEIWSYMHFLMPNLFFSNEDFRDWFYNPFYKAIHCNSNINKKLIITLHQILRPFLLRRLKKDVEKQLPEKIEHVIYCELTRRQRYLYDEYINAENTQSTLQKNDYFSIMNVLMQLRKVCNHPDIFESRDYLTPTRMLFTICIVYPYFAFNILNKDPLNSINLRNIFLLFEDYEKQSKLEYESAISNFPTQAFSKVYKDIIKNKRILWTPNYMIGEGEVLFKRDYADSTILFESNTSDMKPNTNNIVSNLKFTTNSLNYVCPTNIPILQNISLSRYIDLIYSENLYGVNSYNYPDSNINSIFKSNIESKLEQKNRQKIELLNSYDNFSRRNILFKKPIIGTDLVKLIKLNLLGNDFHFNKNVVYTRNLKPTLRNYVTSSVFNKQFNTIYSKTVHNSSTEGNEEINDEGYVELKEDNSSTSNSTRSLYYNNKNYESTFFPLEDLTGRNEDMIEEEIETQNNEDENKISVNANAEIDGNNENHVNASINGFNSKKSKKEKNVSFNQDVLTKDDEENNTSSAHKIEVEKQNRESKDVEDVVTKDEKSNNVKPILKQSSYQKKKQEHVEKPEDLSHIFGRKSEAPFIYEVRDEFREMLYNPTETVHFINSDTFKSLIYTPQKFLNLCEDIMQNFRIHIPKVITSGPRVIPSHHNTDFYNTKHKYQKLYNGLSRIPSVQRYFSLFKTISFPDRKLVEYDSGKLIKLAFLLKKLKSNNSKCLIFTQMTKMLDILEVFLNLHGYKYVRLDGSTRVEMRQTIVDKFNKNEKIFCFISSTRSGGIGLNLTAADSIVFIDTDWNPAMDKQAQDRCHRIGQTRTVNIYRLITQSTIEENIFKKSIQKREMNYVIMEDGKFDTDHFAKLDFKSIVHEEHLIRENKNDDVEEVQKGGKNMLDFENIRFENEDEQKNIEDLLIRIEDMEDVQAFKNASKEMLDEYEKENLEQKFLNNDDIEKENQNAENKDDLGSSLKKIDHYAFKFFNKYYTYDDFVKEKEMKNNMDVAFLNQNESDMSDEFDLGESDHEEENINKLDLDKAYEMYMSKKKQIMKLYEEKKDDEF